MTIGFILLRIQYEGGVTLSFLKSTWFTFCINILDALFHYLDKKGVIHLESNCPEK